MDRNTRQNMQRKGIWSPFFSPGTSAAVYVIVMNLVATHFNCTSPMDYISHHAHTHSRPPLHQSHSCHHSLINPDCLTTPAPHSLTHIKAAHKHSPSAKSCFPLATFPSVFPSLSFRALPGLLTSSSDRLLPASLTSPVLW